MKLGACQEISHAQNLNNWGTAGKSLNPSGVCTCLLSSFCDGGRCLWRPAWVFTTCSICFGACEWWTCRSQTADTQACTFAQAQCQLVEFIEPDVFNRNQSMTNTSRRRFANAQKGQEVQNCSLLLKNAIHIVAFNYDCSNRWNIYETWKHCSYTKYPQKYLYQHQLKCTQLTDKGQKGPSGVMEMVFILIEVTWVYGVVRFSELFA